MDFSEEQRTKEASSITWIGFFINIFLTSFKFFAGVTGNSGAMIADAVHSLSDFATDIVVLISFQITGKPADREHDYGHGKFETLASTIISVALFIVGAGIFYQGTATLYGFFSKGIIPVKPGIIALIAAGLSILVKEMLYRSTAKIANKINSKAVLANAWHHRSDAFSSIGTFLGIGGAIVLGSKWRILDPVAAVIVSLFIIKAAIDIFKPAMNELLEQSLDDKTENDIQRIIEKVDGVINQHNLKTRRIGNNIAIDCHIRVISSLSVSEAHSIACNIENNLRQEYGQRTFISIHIEPEK